MIRMHAALMVLTIFAGVGFFFTLFGGNDRACYTALAVWACMWAAMAAVGS